MSLGFGGPDSICSCFVIQARSGPENCSFVFFCIMFEQSMENYCINGVAVTCSLSMDFEVGDFMAVC
jgi:hypothetical protein